MDFRLTQDQTALRDGVRELLAKRFGRERLRAVLDGEPPGAVWTALAGAGLFALRRPVDREGLGLGPAEAVLAFEEVGRALLPGPLVATELASVHRAFAPGPEPALAGVLRRQAAEPVLVERLPELSVLLVLDAGEVRTVDPAALLPTARQVRAVDPLTPLWQLTAPLPPGEPLPEADPEQLWTEGMLLTAAVQVGLAALALELAVGYARQREQFGRPIGAFQAVQHLCAEMLARLEPARAAVRAAALSGPGGAGAGPLDPVEVAGAKLLADEAAVRGARDCLQVHGGMGFTWEADVHLLLKRAWLLERLFGGTAECAEKAATGLLSTGAETYVGHLS
ncbi:acyl-CoA dehydrogenase family protein [Streptacidiphilus cavernicola]|uniref:Acyl-CoA dehydrogenase family protein n=1 Tax=Streptacidiphilus cavernicola TaxID=3342716 RepID=A0ABV6VNK1_9ACTN